jgi:transcriptional regulator with XRE-family HTH domain
MAVKTRAVMTGCSVLNWEFLRMTRLKSERVRRCLTQNQLAAALGIIHLPDETRKANCCLKNALRISQLLCIQRRELFNDDGLALLLSSADSGNDEEQHET